jgi:hypothetical protein
MSDEDMSDAVYIGVAFSVHIFPCGWLLGCVAYLHLLYVFWGSGLHQAAIKNIWDMKTKK